MLFIVISLEILLTQIFFYEEIEPLLKMPWIAMIEWGDSSIWDLDCPKLEIEIDLVKDSSRDLIFRQIS